MANKTNLSVRFLRESMARQSAFWFYLTFRHQHFWTTSSFCQHSIILVLKISKNHHFMTPYHPSSDYVIYGWYLGTIFSQWVAPFPFLSGFSCFQWKPFGTLQLLVMFFLCFALTQVISSIKPKMGQMNCHRFTYKLRILYAKLFLLHLGITKQVK